MSRITVIGDALWDIELRGEATRLSPDAPVPVVEHTSQRERAGGAALAATLSARDGHDVTFITWLGTDEYAVALRKFLLNEGIDVIGVPLVKGSTPVNIRIGTPQQTLLRVDLGSQPHEGMPMKVASFNAHVSRSDVVLVSDYGRGITSDPMLRLTLRSSDVPVVWDPHPLGSHPVHGCAVVTPNRAEATHHLMMADPLEQAAALRLTWHAEAVAITSGAQGVYVGTEFGARHVPTQPLQGVDPCGAGDRFAVALAQAILEQDVYGAVEQAAAQATAFVAQGAAATVFSGSLASSDISHVV